MTVETKKKNKIIFQITAVFLVLATAAFLSVSISMVAYAAHNNPLTISSVKQFFATSSDSVSSAFTYKFEAVEPGSPMPAGSAAGGYTFTMNGTTSSSIGPIAYSGQGTYRYKLFQVVETPRAYYTYDRQVYNIVVYVGPELDVNIVAYHEDGKKAPDIEFLNGYHYSSTPEEPKPPRPTDPTLMVDPPVKKTISGGTPKYSSVFTFKLAAKNPSNPMPSGSTNGVKTMTITGEGMGEFGTWSYSKAGTYVYTVYEENTKASGYTYDTAVYTITDTVSEKDGELVLSRTVTDNKDTKVTSLNFANQYDSSVEPTDKPPPKPTEKPTEKPTDKPKPPATTESPKTPEPTGTAPTEPTGAPPDTTAPTGSGDNPGTGDTAPTENTKPAGPSGTDPAVPTAPNQTTTSSPARPGRPGTGGTDEEYDYADPFDTPRTQIIFGPDADGVSKNPGVVNKPQAARPNMPAAVKPPGGDGKSPEAIVINQNQPPNRGGLDGPKTGDESDMDFYNMLFVSGAIAAGLALSALFLAGRKKRKKSGDGN